MPDEAPGVDQAGTHIVCLQPRILAQEFIKRVTGGEHAEDMFNGEAPTPDDRLATENTRIGRNASQ